MIDEVSSESKHKKKGGARRTLGLDVAVDDAKSRPELEKKQEKTEEKQKRHRQARTLGLDVSVDDAVEVQVVQALAPVV